MDKQILIHLVYAGVLFAAGLAMGSFLNVVAHRLPRGVSLLHPPSACLSCGKVIPIHDNVPVIGWLVLGGKCRNCRNPIPARYLLVELSTGLLWAAEGWRLAGTAHGFYTNIAIGLIDLAFLSSLVVTFLIDWDHRVIPDEVTLGGLATSLLLSPFLPLPHRADTEAFFVAYYPFLSHLMGDVSPWLRSLLGSLVGVLAGLLFSLLMYMLGTLVFKRQIENAHKKDPEVDSALGLGDVKLMTFFGAFLGWQAVVLIFALGSVLGAATGTLMKVRSGEAGNARGWQALKNRWSSGDSAVPFGPFLVVGALVVFFLDKPLSLLAEQWLAF